jgi:hypothetical protein
MDDDPIVSEIRIESRGPRKYGRSTDDMEGVYNSDNDTYSRID